MTYCAKTPTNGRFFEQMNKQADDLNLNYKLTGKTLNFVATRALMGNMDIDGRRVTRFQFKNSGLCDFA